MNKSELVELVQGHLGGSLAESKQALDAVTAALSDAMAGGHSVLLTGFGTFSVKRRAEKQGRHPGSGQSLTIPAKTVASFKAGKQLQDRLS